MYSWGTASYGALGFDTGEKEDVLRPQKVDIKDYLGKPQRITQIVCGRYHSMCLTESCSVYSWGEGSFGRLGLGDASDHPLPVMVYQLSQRKPIFIAAGESHSAAITEH